MAKGRKKKTTGRFRIDDRHYLVKDTYSWNIKTLDKKGNPEKTTYHATPEQALRFYLQEMRSEGLGNCSDRGIHEALGNLLSSNEMVLNQLGGLFRAILLKCNNDLELVNRLADEVRNSDADRD